MKENLLPKNFREEIDLPNGVRFVLTKVNSFRHRRTDAIINGQKYFYKYESYEVEKPVSSFENTKETFLQKVKKKNSISHKLF